MASRGRPTSRAVGARGPRGVASPRATASRPAPRPRRQAASRGRARRRGRGLPLLVLALAAFLAGTAVAVLGGEDEPTTVERYLAAFERRDFPAMHALLTPAAASRTPLRDFEQAHRRTARTATARAFDAGVPVEDGDGTARVPVAVRTELFGTLRLPLVLRVEGEGDAARIAWREEHAFPGVRAGESLRVETAMPERADLLARDGRALAEGPERASELPPAARTIAGQLGPIPEAEAEAFARRGYPEDARVGVSGLERFLEDELAGTPGGTLLAGRRTLARRAPRPARAVRSTIDPGVQATAETALGGRLGGIAVVDPRSGEVLALAGIAVSGLQPPASTFKIVTAVAGLEAGVTSVGEAYPVETAATIDGVTLRNAHGEACGGDLVTSFADSCNSVFAPMGVEVGARRLVATAERFGFNGPPPFPGAGRSTLPAADDYQGDLDLGSTAIGQGRSLASPLQMTLVAATIANRGRRPDPLLDRADASRSRRVTAPRTAATLRRLMEAVVTEGTGEAAALEGTRVAGKTGTAEIGAAPTSPDAVDEGPDDTAWFVGFAPSRRPRVAVGVMLPSAGAGGEVAAPLARTVLAEALER